MSSTNLREAISTILTVQTKSLNSDADTSSSRLYVVLDASRDELLVPMLQGHATDAVCLYSGSALEEFGDDAPWLAEVKPHEGTLDWLLDEGLGQRWCTFFLSSLDSAALRLHLKKFIRVGRPDNSQVFFRFFDPQVISSYLRFFSQEQRQRFFEGFSKIGFEFGELGFMTVSLRDGEQLDWQLLQKNDQTDVSESDGLIAPPPLDVTSGSAAKPSFIFSQQQLELPIILNGALLIEELIDYLEDDFRPRMNLYPKGMLHMMIDHGIHLAIKVYKITDLTHIKLFVGLMWRIAPGFHKEPELNAVLRRTDIPAEQRFDQILKPQYQNAWSNATDLRASQEWHPFGPSDDTSDKDRR